MIIYTRVATLLLIFAFAAAAVSTAFAGDEPFFLPENVGVVMGSMEFAEAASDVRKKFNHESLYFDRIKTDVHPVIGEKRGPVWRRTLRIATHRLYGDYAAYAGEIVVDIEYRPRMGYRVVAARFEQE